MARYAQHCSTRVTSQTDQARDDQVVNSAGGFVFQLDCWGRLDRFLILGVDGPTYYASEKQLVKENAKCVQDCLKADGPRTVARIVEISDAGRAPKNDAAIFALAMAAASPQEDTRRAALQALPKVCRIGTHLFHFMRDLGAFRTHTGRMLTKHLASWYADKSPEKLAYEVLKYQQRDGWSHRDVLRLAHPKPPSPEHGAIYGWVTGKLDLKEKRDRLPVLLGQYEQLKYADEAACVRMIRDYGFTHEMIPTEHKQSKEVWAALLEKMPITALIRNLAKMTAVGLFGPMGEATRLAAERLTNVDLLKKGRVHPIALLSALRVYQQGHGEKGKLSWTPQREIVYALNEAFYLAFQAVEPTGKNHLLALDVSGSMAQGTIAGCPGIDPRTGSAAMALVTARTEKNYQIVAFTAAARGMGGKWGGGIPSLTILDISPRERLDDVIDKVSRLPMGGTDCALPMMYARDQQVPVDVFVTYTDNETWAGGIHPHQALRDCRNASGRRAKAAVVGMTATEFTIADPNDGGMLDLVGFDSAAPALLADFARS